MNKNNQQAERDARLAQLEDQKSVEMRAFRRTVQKNINAIKTALAKLEAEILKP